MLCFLLPPYANLPTFLSPPSTNHHSTSIMNHESIKISLLKPYHQPNTYPILNLQLTTIPIPIPIPIPISIPIPIPIPINIPIPIPIPILIPIPIPIPIPISNICRPGNNGNWSRLEQVIAWMSARVQSIEQPA